MRAKGNGLHNFAWVYMILANLYDDTFGAENEFSHFSPTGSLFEKNFSLPSLIAYNGDLGSPLFAAPKPALSEIRKLSCIFLGKNLELLCKTLPQLRFVNQN